MEEFSHRFHRDLSSTIVWGFNGHYPGPTITVEANQRLTVHWINNLRHTQTPGTPLRTTHALAVDMCVEGPSFWGTVPRTIPHVHGAHVKAAYDGQPLLAFPPGDNETHHYHNRQPPATLWYHDHAMGLTRLNVYMGLAGFYIIK